MTKRLLLALPLIPIALVLAACGSGAASDPAALQDHTYTTTKATVDGKEADLASGSTLTVTFTADGISVNAGCNTMVGGTDLSNGTITLTGELAATRMACPEDLMAQDDAIAAFLASSPRWSMTGDQLMLSNDSMMVMLDQAS